MLNANILFVDSVRYESNDQVSIIGVYPSTFGVASSHGQRAILPSLTALAIVDGNPEHAPSELRFVIKHVSKDNEVVLCDEVLDLAEDKKRAIDDNHSFRVYMSNTFSPILVPGDCLVRAGIFDADKQIADANLFLWPMEDENVKTVEPQSSRNSE